MPAEDGRKPKKFMTAEWYLQRIQTFNTDQDVLKSWFPELSEKEEKGSELTIKSVI